MKKISILLFLIYFNVAKGQDIFLTNNWAVTTQNGVNVNAHIFSPLGLSNLGHSYTINENVINVSICFYATALAMTTNQVFTYFIPTSENLNYTINLSVYKSENPSTCDFGNLETSSNFPLNVTEFSQISNTLKIYPNPTNGLLYFDIKNQSIKRIEFYNLTGQLLLVTDGISTNISNLENGTYLASIITDLEVITKKIILFK